MAFADTIRSRIYTANDIADKLDALVVADINGTYTYAGVASGTNTITASLSQAPSAYANGQRFVLVAGGTNTGSATLNINGLGAITIRNNCSNANLVSNEIISGSVYTFVYYNSLFYLMDASPSYVTWSPTLGGFSANPTSSTYYYYLYCKWCHVFVRQGAHGTSNATTFTISAPFTAATVTNMIWGANCWQATDNGTATDGKSYAYIGSAGTTITLEKQQSSTAWTGSGNKSASFQLSYLIA